MRDVTRIVLVDPDEASRNALRGLLSGIGTIWLAEVFDTYQKAAPRVGEIGPHLTIINLDSDPNQAIELSQVLTRHHPNVVVLPASRSTDSALILRAIRAGAREFLTLPAEPSEFLGILERLLSRGEDSQATTPRGPQIIAVTGTTGGVGCTTVAVNLATTLASRKEQETILLDLDLVFGSVDASLDILSDNSIYSVIQSFDRLDLTLLKRSLTRHGSGLYVLPRPSAIEEVAKVDPDGLRRLLGLFKAAFGTVVIDTSKGLQSTDFAAFEAADLILLVVQLDLTCIRNSARLVGLLHKFDDLADRLRLVVNRTGSTETEISPKKAEETLKLPISWEIPNATRVFQPARIRGVPISEIAKGSRSHEVFLEMARSLRPAVESEPARPRKGLFAALF